MSATRTVAAIVALLGLLESACGDEHVALDGAGPDGHDAHDGTGGDHDDGEAPAATDAADVTIHGGIDIFVPADVGEPLGGDRPARVVLPEGYDPATAWPLVLLLHGYSVDGAIQDAYLGWSAAASRAGFITLIPDGTTSPAGLRFWNTSPAWCCDFWGTGVDDAGYLVGLVAEAHRRWHVDPGRVFAFGHSNGGFMVHKLACDHADLFAAVGSLAGSLPVAGQDCAPSRPVSVLQIHGTLDATIVYGGNADYPGAELVAARWAAYDTCDATPEVAPAVDRDQAVAGPETIRSAWSQCGGGVSVALWTMHGSGHIPALTPDFVDDVLAWLGARGRSRAAEGP